MIAVKLALNFSVEAVNVAPCINIMLMLLLTFLYFWGY